MGFSVPEIISCSGPAPSNGHTLGVAGVILNLTVTHWEKSEKKTDEINVDHNFMYPNVSKTVQY